ncbi:MAG: amino acid ABC transporter permease [Anaerolineae bacterium]|nr:amino acid ABC transporter permease [Anaerolineae bacterium]MCI0607539.1 amino acid ABC transporter permease [Anaerolineae bacterium]
MAAIEMQPPRLSVGPIAWLKKNLFSTWYNVLLTFLALGLLYALLKPALQWALTEARWGVIEANLTLFMIGQYPREQLWRVWLTIYMLGGMIGLSWGIWKEAARGFALIALGAGLAFIVIGLLLNSNVWINWLIADAVLLAFYALGRILPQRGASIATLGWLLYFPLIFLLVAGTRFIPWLPPVNTNQWGGLLLTLMLTIVGNIGALPLGVLLALGRRSKLPILRYFSIGYIELIRGVPLVTVLFMANLLVPLFLPVNLRPPDAVIRVMIGFIMFEAAYQAENVRGGLQAINRGQYEAAQALGLSGALTMSLIVLPQALRAVIPALFNSFISLFKDTSLVAIIGLFDILRIARSVLAQSDWLGTHREVFLFAFIIYWGFNLAFTYGSRRLEEAMGVGKR